MSEEKTYTEAEIKAIIKDAVEEGRNDDNGIGWEGDAAVHGMCYLRDNLFKKFSSDKNKKG